jgi:hypothetical protein
MSRLMSRDISEGIWLAGDSVTIPVKARPVPWKTPVLSQHDREGDHEHGVAGFIGDPNSHVVEGSRR